MSQTTWLRDIVNKNPYPSLDSWITADVAVIGGGITGTITAYLLARAGKKVAMIDKGTLESSTTAYTTAFITQVIDTSLTNLISIYDKETATKIWRAGKEAIEHIEEIVDREEIKCEFTRTSEYIYATSDAEAKKLEVEAKAAQSAGFPGVIFHKTGLQFENHGYLEIPNQAKFHPLKFLVELREKFTQIGGRIYECTEALGIEEMIDDLRVVVTKKGRIEATDVVVTTHKPFNNPPKLFPHKGMYTSYVLELEIPKGEVKEGLYLDLKNPYHYFRVDNGEHVDRIMVGGEDHRSELHLDPEKSYKALCDYIENLFPKMKYTSTRRWRGSILEPIDSIPYIGRYSKDFPNEYTATAFSGNGMTYASIAATIIRDLIMEKDNEYAEIFDASRKISKKPLIKKRMEFTSRR